MLFKFARRSFKANCCVGSFFRRYLSSNRPSFMELGKKSLVFSENDGHVMKSPFGSVSIPDMTIDQYVWQNISKWHNHIAVECGITGRKYAYAKLRDHCAALAIRLRRDLKLQKSDIISVCLPNVPEYVIALLGSLESGLVVTTVNPSYTSEEISRQMLSCRPKAIVCLAEHIDVVRKACTLAQQTDIKTITLQSDPNSPKPNDTISLNELINTNGLTLSDSAQFNKDIDYNDLALLPYSSGTTGMPKGVMLTHRNLVSNCQSISVPLPEKPITFPTTNDFQEILPCFLPFYHIYGSMVIMIPKMAVGAKIVSIPKYEVNSFLRIVKEHRATILHLVPPVVIQMNNHHGCTPEHFENVRNVMCAASSLAHSDGECFKKIAKDATFFQGYGLTETSPICTITPNRLDNYGTIGWPVPNVEMKIANLDDPTYKGQAINQSGEILVRGPNIMKGYFNNDEATKNMITSDGWLRTGDIGHMDEDGLFYISDRLKELIKVNANQVAPAELEGILREHPDVENAVVIGIPHPKYGEVPKAFILRRPNATATESDIQQFVAKQVIKFKQLTGGVQFVDYIPKTPTGKVLRREVRKLYM